MLNNVRIKKSDVIKREKFVSKNNDNHLETSCLKDLNLSDFEKSFEDLSLKTCDELKNNLANCELNESESELLDETSNYFPSCVVGLLPLLKRKCNEYNASNIKIEETSIKDDVVVLNGIIYFVLHFKLKFIVCFVLEIPYVTIKKLPAEINKPSDYLVDKILRLHVENILNSGRIQKNPDIFLFQNIKYRFVRITGTVSYLNRVSGSKIFLKSNLSFCF